MHNALARDGSENPLVIPIDKDCSVQPGSAA